MTAEVKKDTTEVTVEEKVIINTTSPTISMNALGGDGVVSVTERCWINYNR